MTWKDFRGAKASQILHQLKVQDRYHTDVTYICERLGIRLEEVDESVNWAGAMQLVVGVPYIYTRKADAHVHRRFTIAHELGHLLLHDTDILYRCMEGLPAYNLKEKEASRFASELLMPIDSVIHIGPLAGFCVEKMAGIFEVGVPAMSIRFTDILLNREGASEGYELRQKKPARGIFDFFGF